MAINVEERLAQLDSLNCFIENSREKFASILSILGWDVDTLREQVGYSNCVLYVCGCEVCSKCITESKRQNPASSIKPERRTSVVIVSTFLVDDLLGRRNLKEHTLCH